MNGVSEGRSSAQQCVIDNEDQSVRRRKTRTADVMISSGTSVTFEGMLLPERLLVGLRSAGFVRPSPIQFEAIPVGRCGFDMVVQAKSGTGKTVVFCVVALEGVRIDCRSVQTLILGPTREIVVQISQVVLSLCSAMPALRCHAFIGGLPVADDQIKLKKCHIAIGTPGKHFRIKQLIQEGFLKTDAIRLFVLDEADKLLDDNFQESINWIYRRLPTSKQVLATSATYPESLAQLLTKYMQSPTFVRLNVQSPVLLGLKQFYRLTEFHPSLQKSYENKLPSLMEILSSLPFGQCFIFSNYQLRAQGLCDRLRLSGWPTTFISGKQEQGERLRAIDKLKQFRCRILVSTDLTARGIDAENVDLVINLDVPWDTDTYLHRIGRAGRYGSSGIAVTLASKGEEEKLLKQIQKNGNLNMKLLPGRLNEDVWKCDPAEVNVVPAQNRLEVESDKDDETVTSPSEEEPVVVGAGLIESLEEMENLTLEAQGVQIKRDKLGSRDNGECTGGRGTANRELENDVTKSINSRLFEGTGATKRKISKTRFSYEQSRLSRENGDPAVESDRGEYDREETEDDDDEDDEILSELIESVVLSSRIDFYRGVKAELTKVWNSEEDENNRVEFGRCLRYLALLMLPQLSASTPHRTN